MREIVKALIGPLAVPVPVAAPCDRDAPRVTDADDQPGEEAKAPEIGPVDRIGREVNSAARR